MEFPRDNPLRRSLSTGRGALLPIGLFSMVFNVLALAVPLYMMQIYDRVLNSGSQETTAPVDSKPSTDSRWPSWKIQTTTP